MPAMRVVRVFVEVEHRKRRIALILERMVDEQLACERRVELSHIAL